MSAPVERWDIFCRVVDNFGDVGVAWRLARQVAHEHRKDVRLWVDDLTVLAKLRPEIDVAYDSQRLEGVEVVRVREPFVADEIADVVVETFGCDPPDTYVLAMAAREPRPRWINLEYLSAEDWVEGSHALPSPNPRLPLVKHFFFPGFTRKAGGLLRESDLLAVRQSFLEDEEAVATFWRSLTGRTPPQGGLKLSLFGYADAPFESLARACERYPGPVWLIAPEGYAATALAARAARRGRRTNDRDGGMRRELEVIVVPFLPQDRYDRLLWACDVNFVRGEDSFVRAQWAGRPFVWNVYPTDDGAHWVKMSAFLARYTANMERSHAGAVTALWEAWNRPTQAPAGEADVAPEAEPVRPAVAQAWPAFAARLPALEAHAAQWATGLARQRDLAAQLVDFCDNVLK
jgi:uncharacterized repeat protein (TIGR03837 family)